MCIHDKAACQVFVCAWMITFICMYIYSHTHMGSYLVYRCANTSD